jgi:hypothetical protein
MAGQMVPSAGGGNFAQQGSVDGVALSGSTLSFSIDVLSRISKAGVEMIAVAVGQAMCGSFNIPAAGQKRLQEAIARLKAFSSYGKILWFRFGVKSIVRTLCETEQGAACAAVCACLSVSYDTYFSSQVLRPLADGSSTPRPLTPALSQWAALMNVCAGAVTDSKFPILVQGFSNIFEFRGQNPRILALHEATNAVALANALFVVTKGSTPPGGVEGPGTIDYFSGGRPWKGLESSLPQGRRPINTAYLSAVESE